MTVFEKRVAFKPFEYPEVERFKEAINHSYWLVTEWNFSGDVQDYHVTLTDIERNAVRNSLLAISQIEVSVKRFWTNLGNRFPKPEFEQVGVTFGESEVRHSDAYSALLKKLGLNDDFDAILQNPVIHARVEYLAKYLRGAQQSSNEEYSMALTLFSIFIENVSLFSQFAIIKSFNKQNGAVLKNIDNVVQATLKEEVIHAMFGVELLKIVKREHPEWFGEEFYSQIRRASLKAFQAESNIIDWIFEKGELSFLPKRSVIEFLKSRFNESLALIGAEPVFEVDAAALDCLRWFIEEIYATVDTDFFHKKPVTYTKKAKSIRAEDLF